MPYKAQIIVHQHPEGDKFHITFVTNDKEYEISIPIKDLVSVVDSYKEIADHTTKLDLEEV